ncbi:MAG: type III-B CRISPR-associated protein Cas10/Cmr2 [Methylohalobius crimeensis]
MASRYLVSLALGPVQDFIAAALRTRDLWFGSYLLSEVSKAAAQGMQQSGAELIFPPSTQSSDQEPRTPFNVANRIVAEVNGNAEQARSVCEAGKEAAQQRWLELVEDAKNEYHRLISDKPLRHDIIERQQKDMLERFANWTALTEDYNDARNTLDRLSAARKNTRDFHATASDPKAAPFFGLPKSSLDGRRETVLPKDLNDTERRKLRLGQGEQLDLPGLVKRLAERNRSEQFTAVTRIALDPWLRLFSSPTDMEKLRGIFEQAKSDLGDAFITRVTGNEKIYRDFPYDGELLYPDRIEAAINRMKNDESCRAALRKLRRDLQPFWKTHGSPPTYYALLMADGDYMGKLLDRAESADGHREISRVLTDFAKSVPELLRRHRGHCIYAGGDDILALIPLDKALACAEALRRRFAERFERLADAMNVAPKPSLSVGIAATHMLTPLGRVRQWAGEAEKLAKGNDRDKPRNALAIVIHPRSGSPIQWRQRWDETPSPVDALKRWQRDYKENRLPSKLPYDLRAAMTELEGLKASDQDGYKELARLEFKRILGRKRGSAGAEEIPKEIRKALEKDWESFGEKTWEGLIIARWLTAKGGMD